MLNRKIASRTLYRDPNSKAAEHLSAHPEDASWLKRVVDTPQAIWITSIAAISGFQASIDAAQARDEIVVAVLYFVPGRDTGGGFSAGGAQSDQEYQSFVDTVCSAIGDRQVIAIVEPDAVPDIFSGKLGVAQASRRTALLQYACARLAVLSRTDVYLDCGHAYWPDENKLNQWLNEHRMLDQVTGIALNVSNFKPTHDCLARATKLLPNMSGEPLPVIVDCSRNGTRLSPDLQGEDEWCNPIGARLGPEPSLQMLDFHGQMWIKRPGESDGEHNGGPKAGEFCRELCRKLCGADRP